MILSLSLTFTDFYQSAPVIPYTIDNPLVIQHNNNTKILYEGNKDIAGDPKAAGDCLEFSIKGISQAPWYVNLSNVLIRIPVVMSNNKLLEDAGLPIVWWIIFPIQF